MQFSKRNLFSLVLGFAVVVLTMLVFGLKGRQEPTETQAMPKLGLDRYNFFGGWRGMCQFEKKGFFYVAERDGVWWLVDPLGCAFVSKGVNHVSPYGDYSPALGYSPYERWVKAKHESVDAWLEVTVLRLRSWGFNTIGSWSYEQLFLQMPYTVILDVMASYGFNWVTGAVPDIFDAKFEEHAESVAVSKCKPRVRDPLLLGYFLDNELRWGPDWRSQRNLLDDFIKLPAEAPGKRVAAEALVEACGGDLAELGRKLGIRLENFEDLLRFNGEIPAGGVFDKARSLFLSKFAERYFSVAVNSVKKHDPNHLVLGVRFAGLPPSEVLEAAGKYLDVISVNFYTYGSHEPPIDALKRIYELTGKPIMVTEFSYKAMDSGLPNTKGASEPVKTQRERSYLAARYVLRIMALPYVVGYHWFQYTDQPKEGRFDGENSNYGLMKIEDEPWELLTKVFHYVNGKAEEVHAGLVGAEDALKQVIEMVKRG